MQEATEDNCILLDGPFDLIVSLISWGYHYPVATYLDAAYAKLSQNGTLILDIRKNTGGLEEVKDTFGNAKIVYESAKYQRVLAKKSA